MLEEARRIFAERGFASTSMDEIAQACGVTKPMLYAYFDSKEGLFRACTREAAEGLYAAVRAAAEEGTSNEDRLWRGFVAVFGFVEDNRESWKLLFPSGPAAVGAFAETAQEATERMAELLAELFARQALSEGINPDLAAESQVLGQAVTGATVAVASWWQETRPHEPREMQALRLMNVVWMGMANVTGGQMWLPKGG